MIFDLIRNDIIQFGNSVIDYCFQPTMMKIIGGHVGGDYTNLGFWLTYKLSKPYTLHCEVFFTTVRLS